MKRILILILILVGVISFSGLDVMAQDCQFPDKAPDPANFQFMVGNQIQVQQTDNRWVDATVTMVIPWWDMNACKWRVNYNAEIKSVLRFTEGDPAVRIKPLPVGN